MSTLSARAFWIAAPGRGEIREETVAPPRDDELLVAADYSGISRGTESIVFNGRVPASERSRMRAPFQSGEFPAPVKYGYASVGHVERGPGGLVGQPVFALFPHQTRYVLPAESVIPIPPGVPPARAVLAANMETAINVVWDADVRVGDVVSVIGGGTVGCLVAWLAASIRGCSVELVDVNPSRAAIASKLGVRFAPPQDAAIDADVVIHTSGSPDGLTTALRLAAFEATVVEASWYGSQRVTLPLGEAFHSRRLTLRSSQVGAVAPSQRSRWSSRRRLTLAVQLLVDPRLDALITGESAFDELPDVMPRLAASSGETLCHRITYS